MDPRRVERVLRQHLETDRLLGVAAVPYRAVEVELGGDEGPMAAPVNAITTTPVSDAGAGAVAGAGPSMAPPVTRPIPVPSRPAAPPASTTPIPELVGDKGARLAQLREHMLANAALQQRVDPNAKLVFGEGDPNAAIMFIGEAPGADEARMGRPFVGRAGQLLDDMIIKGMKLAREQVYITNMVNFRPPDNRVPTPDEIAMCRAYMIGQVETVRPRVIVALGGTAAKGLLQTATGITRLRGHWHAFNEVNPPIDLMPTFHPAFLLRQYTTENRRKAWEDLKAVLEKVGSG